MTYSINVLDYGAVGNGVTDDTNAIRSAISAALSSGIGTIVFPWGITGTYLCSDRIIEGTNVFGLKFKAVGRQGVNNGFVGVRILYTGSQACFDIQGDPNPTTLKGTLSWTGFYFQCTNPVATMFKFNTDDVTNTILRGVFFDNCEFFGPAGGVSQTGDAINAYFVFQLVISATCIFMGWRRAVRIRDCDNCKIDGVYMNNARHIMIESVEGGSQCLITAAQLGFPAAASSEPSYQLYDQGVHTTLIGTAFADTNDTLGANLTAHMYLGGSNGTLVTPRYSAGNIPLFEMGPNAHSYFMLSPETAFIDKTPIYAEPVSYDTATTNIFYGITIVEPRWSIKAKIPPHPRLRMIGGMHSKDRIIDEEDHVITAAGPSQKRFVNTPFNHWGRTHSVPIESIVADPGGYFDYAIKLSTATVSGFKNQLTVGKHLKEGDTIKITTWHRMSAIPGAGDFRIQILKNGANVTQAVITNSTTYARFTMAYKLSGFVDGDLFEVRIYNNSTSVNLFVAYLLLELVDSANPDTSGATLAALETEVNELKATMRKFGLLAE